MSRDLKRSAHLQPKIIQIGNETFDIGKTKPKHQKCYEEALKVFKQNGKLEDDECLKLAEDNIKENWTPRIVIGWRKKWRKGDFENRRGGSLKSKSFSGYLELRPY